MQTHLLPVAKAAMPSVIALGFFDGCHIGHRSLFEKTVSLAKVHGLIPAVFTFTDATVKNRVPTILTSDERLHRMALGGIEHVFMANFSDVRALSPEEFVKDILLGMCDARIAVCGPNFRFGAGATGDPARLCALMEQAGGMCVTLPALTVDGVTVSATEIRRSLAEGQMASVARMLGEGYTVTGEVLHGKGLGRTLGFPTANQALPEGCATPKSGVYATEAVIDGVTYPAVTNIGTHPTVDAFALRNAETHIIGYTGDLYGKQLTVRFLRFLREEERFQSVERLSEQLKKDIKEAIKA